MRLKLISHNGKDMGPESTVFKICVVCRTRFEGRERVSAGIVSYCKISDVTLAEGAAS